MLSDIHLNLMRDATTGVVTPLAVTTSSVVSAQSIDRLSNQDFGSGASMSLVFNTEATVVPGKNNVTVNTPASAAGFPLATHGLTSGSPVVLQGALKDPILSANITGVQPITLLGWTLVT